MTAPAGENSAETDQTETEVIQPGLGELREAVANHLPPAPFRGSLRQDAIAGLNSAVASVPDGMASGILAGVNPIYGLYASMVGPVAGALFASSRLMVVTTTSAASLSAGQALGVLQGEARDDALFIMVLLIGVLQIVAGLLRLGQLTRFVSYSVMTGLIIGIAVLTILSQLPTVAGYEPTAGPGTVGRAVELLMNLDQANWRSLTLAAVTLALAVVLPRTRLSTLGSLVAIIVPSLLALLLNFDSVAVVRDIGDIPGGIPMPHLPALSSMSFDVLSGALAVAVIVLVQGAGVSQSVPNPDGSRRSMSRDFIAQGAANVASGFFRGLPVGGSLKTTALTVVAGARTRWAAVFAGLWMALLVGVFPVLVSYVAMPALGVMLIVVSSSTIKPSDALSIWNAGWQSRLAGITTFLATLFLPIQAAVGLGVVLSALLYVNESSTDVSVIELVKHTDKRIKERTPNDRLPSNKVTVLDVYGHLFYAGARTLERLLPTPEGARSPVVVLRLRGRKHIGATLLEVLAAYAGKLHTANGRLYLTGISKDAYEQIARAGKLHLSGPVRVYEASAIRGESTDAAYADAQAWLASEIASRPGRER